VTARGLTTLALAAALAMTSAAACSTTQHRANELVVGSRPDAESVLLADIYTGALRSYGVPSRTEQAPDPLTKLDSGAFVVVPGFTGRVLQVFQPGATARSDAQVYKAMVGALPEGIAAGDYTTAADDKPALAVTKSTAKSWGGNDLSAVPRHCDGIVIGSIAGRSTPPVLGGCRPPAAHEFHDDASLFTALQAGNVTAAWTTTADPDVPLGLVVLNDAKPALVQAENVVPL
jgi:glycine betaine/choline ABC-type transport system substrate-binding protein